MWILFILSDGPDYGYNIIQRLDKLFAGHWKPKPGTIYPALDMLAQDGYLSRSHEHRDEGLDRRNYTITLKGQDALRVGMERWSRVMEYVELYGERHRSLRKFKAGVTREEAGGMLVRLGEGIIRGKFDVVEALPNLEPMSVIVPQNTIFKFIYAPEGDGFEIEVEVEWPQKEKSEI
jgi:DNA-binding PadR family transcriptional regulator